jgi:nanoRNase/pAp phosphatase (c-di-AMP/oligoRNAs hydrolase)
MINELITEIGLDLPASIATNLYMGIFGDTGGFMHANTTSEVFRIAHDLVAGGVDPHAVAYRIKKTKALAFYKVLCTVMDRMIQKDRVMAITRPTRRSSAGCSPRTPRASRGDGPLGGATSSSS